MTNPNPGGVRQAAPGTTAAMPIPWVQAQVMSLDMDRSMAICLDTMTRQIEVRMDIQRGKGSVPAVGETWIIDKYYGVWTFAAMLRGDTSGVVTPIENIPDLAPTLQDKQNQIDNQASLLAGSQLTMTVTAVQGGTGATNRRYLDGTLADGTAVTGVPVVGAYYPMAGDTAWVLRQPIPNDANSTPQLIAIGKAGVAPGTPLGQGQLIRPQLVAESVLYLMADKRMTAPSSGVYQLARGFIDASGNPQYGSWIDTVQYALPNNDFTVLERNNVRNSGIYWGNSAFYFTLGDGTGRSQVWGKAFGASDGGGIGMGADANNNPAIVMNRANVAMIGGTDGSMYFTNAANSARVAIRAGDVWASLGMRAETGISTGGVLVVDGQTTFNGGVVGNQGAAFTGLPLRAASFTVGGYAPALNQIQTYDETVNNNLAVAGTFFYRGTAQPVAASERDLKEHIENLGDPWGFIDSLVPARYTWKDQEHFDDRRHVGLYVNEMADADPDTVVTMPQMPLDMFGYDEDDNANVLPAIRYNSNIGRSYEDRAVIAYLVRAVQDLKKRLSERS